MKGSKKILPFKLKPPNISIIILAVLLVLSLSTVIFLTIKINQYQQEIRVLIEERDAAQSQLDATQEPSYFTNYFPVKFISWQSQKLGQSFQLNDERTISKLILKGSFGVGGDLIITIHELIGPEAVELSSPIGSGTFAATDIIKEKEFIVEFEEPIILEAETKYMFVVEVENRKTQAGIGFAEADIYENGKMYRYTPLYGGNGELLDPRHSWQPRNSYDVIFRLDSE